MNYLPLLNLLEDLNLDYSITRMKEKNNHEVTTFVRDVMVSVVVSDSELLEIIVTDDYWRYPELTSYFPNSIRVDGTFTYRQGTPFLKDIVGILGDLLGNELK